MPRAAPAFFHGAKVKPAFNAGQAEDCIAIGNIILANDRVPPAMAEAFAADPSLHLAERLLRGLEAGLALGASTGRCSRPCCWSCIGELPAGRSAHRQRRRSHPAPARAVWEECLPWMDEFVIRAVEPDRAQGVS
ncbi:MAG: DUF1028 domain-containing protein [Burkholderiales bacterium]|nr:DUF1028 domain-containing protein [Burkholderiales bacterium]